MNVNIGGGLFHCPGWLNLDQRFGFRLTPTTNFPLPDKTAPIVYSSHCLEHLDDATVDRVLAEARRVCAGHLVLKLPDFDEVLRRWRAGDADYFKLWAIDKAVPTWKCKGVADTIDARAATIFCGWWNAAFGDEYGDRRPGATGAYHGPAVMPNEVMAGTLENYQPHQIARWFRLYVEANERYFTFNHQNAWSRDELTRLLERHGFTVETMDAGEVCGMPIPTITELRGISLYVRCR